MKRSMVTAIAVLAMLPGCAGTRLPKLAKCTGPYRYANIYGTVLPSLPIPGQVQPAAAPIPQDPGSAPRTSEEPKAPPAPTPASPMPLPSPSASGKTSAPSPSYPSC